MTANIFIDKTEGGGVEITVVQDGLTSGAARKYSEFDKAKAVLLAFGFDPRLVDHQLQVLSDMPPSVLLRFPVAEIDDDVLRSRGYTAAAFQVA